MEPKETEEKKCKIPYGVIIGIAGVVVALLIAFGTRGPAIGTDATIGSAGEASTEWGETEEETESEAETEEVTESEVETEEVTESEVETEEVTESEPETEEETEPETEPESEAETEEVTRPETEPETQPELPPQTEPETQPEIIGETEAIDEETLQEELSRWSEVIEAAEKKAIQYDYDGAIALLKGQEGYEDSPLLKNTVIEYQKTKASCVRYTPDMVAHVFTHSLIVDFNRAFDGDGRSYAYNKDMLTVDEFRRIIQSMYDRGYVLVSVHDMAEMGPDGKMYPKSIWLPEGKKPVVFSQDDVSYYHIYEGDGFADCLFVDENGKVKNKYTDAAGNVLVGDYDMVPIIDTFVEEHPDFSYRGRKGIVAMTGYNGLFGYRTDTDYRDWTNLLEDQRIWLENHPEYNYEADCAAAKAVADAMKANGWEFASHSWGHISMKDADMGLLARDTYKWETRMEPILGETDILIYAYGADIHSTGMYTSDNAKFAFLRDAGFRYFCNVDGTSLRWCQIGADYMRQGRVNLDGYRLMTGPEKVAELFDATEVLDPRRPRPWG